MYNNPSITPGAGPAPATGSPEIPQLDPVRLFAALGNEVRWAAVQMLAGGAALSAIDVAAALKLDGDSVRKHLRVLLASGAVAAKPGADARLVTYYIPDVFRQAMGALDFGLCRLRLAAAHPTMGKD